MNPQKNKWLFWALVLGVLGISVIPSVVLLQTFQRYWHFLTGFEPDTLRPTKARFLPHRGARKDNADEALRFIEFKISAPKAKRVVLAGDFTRWKTGALPLSKQSKGSWEIAVPLPPGSYHYLYVVDGVESQKSLKVVK